MALFNEPTATREELEAYIGSAAKTPYYKKVLDTYMENPNKPIWCWPAFLISFFWFCYRKATIPTILLILVYLALYAYALVSLPRALGWTVFGVIWGCAILGITLNSINLNKYKKFSMFLYLVMGWMIIFTFKTLLNSIDIAGIYLMLSGGIIYTIGAIFYAVGKKKKYMHSIFHFFVLAASILFFFSIFLYVI